MFKRFTVSLLVFSLPFQLGYHFWFPQSYIKGFGIDYLSPTLYLTDLLIMLFMIQNLSSLKTFVIHFFTRYHGVLFLILVATNIHQSSYNLVTILAWVRIFVYYFLYLTLSGILNLSKLVKKPFILSLMIVIFLVIAQFAKQSSLGGIFYYLGERAISITSPNIAKLKFQIHVLSIPEVSNTKYQILRPYSTFSHPNSLAGYLLISLIIIQHISPSKVLKLLTGLTIILTFSRSAIFTLAAITLLKLNISGNVILAIILSLIPLLNLGRSYSSRLSLLSSSLSIISNNLLFGVGLRQFIPSLASYIPDNQLSYTTLQPVHNLILLIVAEIGIVPVLATGFLLYKTKNSLDTKYYPLVTILLLTGSLDHYWWTLPQNQLIIVLVLALIKNSTFPSQYPRRGIALLRRVRNLNQSVPYDQ